MIDSGLEATVRPGASRWPGRGLGRQLRHAVLIYNPKAGKGRLQSIVDAVLPILRRGGFAVEAVATRGPGDATRLAREATGIPKVEVVFGLGGDGTLRETGAGLLGTQVALGPLPGGTTNVLTMALGLPRDPEAAATALCRLRPAPMDVGLCGAVPFLMMASSGLDAQVMSHLDTDIKSQLGIGGVVLQGLSEWLMYSYPELEVVADGVTHRASLAVVSNIPNYGGPYRIAPEARYDDGLFDLVLFRGSGRSATLSFAMDVTLGTHLEREDVQVFKVKHVRLDRPDGVPVQVDGDGSGLTLPVDVRFAPERLMVLAQPA